MHFVGIDLAWSDRNPSGGAALVGQGDTAELIDWREGLGGDGEIVQFVTGVVGDGPALVAIDAPLVVPNETGARPADRLVTRLFGHYQAGAHPANRRRFGARVRGEDLVARLEAAGFRHSPHIQRQTAARQVFEVYPHPATVALFGLERTLKYKPRQGRSLATRRQAYRALQEHLRNLSQAEPALRCPDDLLARAVDELGPTALKRYEDVLDAVLCAYVAWRCWWSGPEGYAVIGDLDTGYIVTPMTRELNEKWQALSPSEQGGSP